MSFGPVKDFASVASTSPVDSFLSFYYKPGQCRPWMPTLIQFGPLSGIFCMLLAISSLIASLGILAGSDHQPTSNWSSPPATYLAIFTAVANLSVRYAAIQGVIICWWYRAIKGSTLAKLHWDWHSGTTLLGALTAGRDVGLLGLACVVSNVVVIDGPLLQRASTIVSAPYVNRTLPLNVTMAPEIPTNFTGGWASNYFGNHYPYVPAFNDTIPTNNGNASNWVNCFINKDVMLHVTEAWYSDKPMTGIVQGCAGSCKATIRAPALFPTTCKNYVQPVNYFGWFDVRAIMGSGRAPPFDHLAFLTAPSLVVGGRKEYINLVTGYSTTSECKGTLNYTICTLESGIGEYEVSIDQNRVTLDSPSSPKMVALANNTAVNHIGGPQGHNSTLAGILNIVNTVYNSFLGYYPEGKNSTIVDNIAVGPVATTKFMLPSAPDSQCSDFRDPQEDVLRDMNKLMFLTGAYAATQSASYLESRMDPGLEVNSTVTGYLQGPHNVFRTEYLYFVLAAVAELVCIALVAPTYWGWWTLGRPVSFSPLEMAKAFESPMLADFDSNSSGRDLAKAFGDTHVRYGVASSDKMRQTVKLAFAHTDLTSPPRNGDHFGV